MVRYFFGAFGSAVVLPAVEKIGVGWFSTISALFLFISAVGTYFTAIYGEGWRKSMDQRKENRHSSTM
jgi:hypothetical protein